MTTGFSPRRTERLRPPSASVHLVRDGEYTAYKLVDISSESAVLQGAPVGDAETVRFVLARPGHAVVVSVATVKRQVMIAGQVLLELELDVLDTALQRALAQLLSQRLATTSR